jgi:hypothetical protein
VVGVLDLGVVLEQLSDRQAVRLADVEQRVAGLDRVRAVITELKGAPKKSSLEAVGKVIRRRAWRYQWRGRTLARRQGSARSRTATAANVPFPSAMTFTRVVLQSDGEEGNEGRGERAASETTTAQRASKHKLIIVIVASQ